MRQSAVRHFARHHNMTTHPSLALFSSYTLPRRKSDLVLHSKTDTDSLKASGYGGNGGSKSSENLPFDPEPPEIRGKPIICVKCGCVRNVYCSVSEDGEFWTCSMCKKVNKAAVTVFRGSGIEDDANQSGNIQEFPELRYKTVAYHQHVDHGENHSCASDSESMNLLFMFDETIVQDMDICNGVKNGILGALEKTRSRAASAIGLGVFSTIHRQYSMKSAHCIRADSYVHSNSNDIDTKVNLRMKHQYMAKVDETSLQSFSTIFDQVFDHEEDTNRAGKARKRNLHTALSIGLKILSTSTSKGKKQNRMIIVLGGYPSIGPGSIDYRNGNFYSQSQSDGQSESDIGIDGETVQIWEDLGSLAARNGILLDFYCVGFEPVCFPLLSRIGNVVILRHVESLKRDIMRNVLSRMEYFDGVSVSVSVSKPLDIRHVIGPVVSLRNQNTNSNINGDGDGIGDQDIDDFSVSQSNSNSNSNVINAITVDMGSVSDNTSLSCFFEMDEDILIDELYVQIVVRMSGSGSAKAEAGNVRVTRVATFKITPISLGISENRLYPYIQSCDYRVLISMIGKYALTNSLSHLDSSVSMDLDMGKSLNETSASAKSQSRSIWQKLAHSFLDYDGGSGSNSRDHFRFRYRSRAIQYIDRVASCIGETLSFSDSASSASATSRDEIKDQMEKVLFSLYMLRRGKMLSGALQHIDDVSEMKVRFQAANMDATLLMVCPRLYSVSVSGDGIHLEELAPFDLYVHSDSASDSVFLLDCWSEVYVWYGQNVANAMGNDDKLKLNSIFNGDDDSYEYDYSYNGDDINRIFHAMKHANMLGTSRFPPSEVMLFSENDSFARYLNVCLAPSRRDSAEIREMKCPGFGFNYSKHATAFLASLPSHDELSYSEWLNAIGVSANIR